MFDIVFVQLGVIPRTKRRFIEIVAVEERYLIMTQVKKYRMKEEVVPNMPSCKISWWKNAKKKGKICSNLIYSIVSLDKMAGKTESFLNYVK